MNDELKRKLIQLKKLKELLDLKSDYKNKLSVDKQSYIDIRIKKPEIKQIMPIKEPKKPILYSLPPKMLTVFALLMPFFVAFILVWIGLCAEWSSTVCGIVVMIGVISSFIYFGNKLEKNKDYSAALKKCEQIKSENLEIERYNKEIFPTELKRYEEECQKIEDEYNKEMAEIEQEYQQVCEEIDKHNDVLHPKYQSGLNGIIEIIESERADSFKEALNLYIQEQNDFAYKKAQLDFQAKKWELEMEEKIKHNAEMERVAQEQADAAREQASLAKKRAYESEHSPTSVGQWASRCHQCKRYASCNRDPVNCMFYQP